MHGDICNIIDGRPVLAAKWSARRRANTFGGQMEKLANKPVSAA